jgi:hypothetical protein
MTLLYVIHGVYGFNMYIVHTGIYAYILGSTQLKYKEIIYIKREYAS